MKQVTKLKSSTAIAVIGGCGLAAAWYALSQLAFSGTAETVLPVLGAIVIAGTVPSLVMNRASKRASRETRFSMTQRLDAFGKHACINIVDENDKLSEVNDKLLELTGYDRDELIGRPVTFLYNDIEKEVAAEIRDNLRRGKSWEGETRLRRKDGCVVFTQSTIMPLFDRAGKWAGSISVRTDVSRTNELIAERHTAQTLYELRDDVWIIDAESETFSYLNRAAERRFSTSYSNYRGQSLSKVDHEGHSLDVLTACREMKANEQTVARFQTIIMDVSVDVSIKFLHGLEDAGRFLIVITDISERVEREKHSSAFISMVSHELRSPLTSIKGAMGLLLSKSAGELPKAAVSLLEIAHRNADRLVLIINDILDLEKIADGQMEIDLKEVDLVALIQEADQANAMLQQRFGVKVQLKGMDTPVPFNTDPNRFIQVLTNLLSNAYKFSRPGTTIYVEVQEEDTHVSVFVKDEGQGIPQDEQHKIFSRFSDMTNSDRALKGGTGLGLNICKAIVENMGGTIGFESAEGVGTTFYFRLPRVSLNSNANLIDLAVR